MKASKFFLSTFIAAAAMTSTAWGIELSIGSYDDLCTFRDAVNGSGESDSYTIGDQTFTAAEARTATVTLTADIDLYNEKWIPIGNATKSEDLNKFKGTFNGGGHTISNLVVENGSTSNAGFFGWTVDGSISNLTIHNAKVSGRLNVGVVAGTPYTSTYDNIKVTGVVQVSGLAYVGGMFGKNVYANVSNLTIDVDETAAEESYVKANSVENGIAYRTYVGGVIGFMGEGGHTVSDVKSDISVEGSTCDVGGIAGIAHYGNKFVDVECSAESVTVKSNDSEVGAIAGVWHNESGTTVTFENCTSTAEITKTYTNDAGESVTETLSGGEALYGSAYNTTGTGSLNVSASGIKQYAANAVVGAGAVETYNDGVVIGDSSFYDEPVEDDGAMSAQVTVKGTLTAGGTWFWVGGEHEGDYDTNGASKRFGLVVDGGTVNVEANEGMNIRPAGYVTVQNGGTLNTAYVVGENAQISVSGEGSKIAVVHNDINLLNASEMTISDGGSVEFIYENEGSTNSLNISGESVVNVNGGVLKSTDVAGVQTQKITIDSTSTLNISDNGVVKFDAIENEGNVSIDGTSTLVAGSISNKGTITLKTDGLSGIRKVIDLSQTASLKGENFVVSHDATIGNYGVIYGDDGDVTLGVAKTGTLYVDSNWTSQDAIQSEFADVFVQGTNAFGTLSDAASASKEGTTIELSGTGTLSSAAAFMNGGTVVLTGNAAFDWSKGWFFIGRGEEEDDAQDTTVHIKDATITSVSDTKSFGFHVSGAEKDSPNKAYGTLIIENSSVVVDYLMNKNIVNVIGNGNSDDGVVDLYVKNGFSVGGRPGTETESGEAHHAMMNLTNGAYVKVKNHNGMGVGYEDLGSLNISDSKFEAEEAFLVTEKGTINLNNGTFIAPTLTNDGTITVSGTSAVKANVSGTGWIYMKDAVLDGNTNIQGGKIRFAQGTSTLSGATLDNGFFQVGIGAYNGEDTNVDTENGVTVNVSDNSVIGSIDEAYAGWIGSGFYDTDAEKTAAMTGARYTLNINDSIAVFGYLHVSQDGILNVAGNAKTLETYNNSAYTFRAGDFIINGTATFDACNVLAFYTKVSCDNGTDTPGRLIIKNGAYYEAEPHNGATTANSFNIYKTGRVDVLSDSMLKIGDVTTISADGHLNVDDSTVDADGVINNSGTIVVTGDSKFTAAQTLTNNGLVDVGAGSVLTAKVIAGEGDVILAGTMVVTDGSFEAGNVTLHSGAYLGSVVPTKGVMLSSEVEFSATGTVTIVADEGLDLSAEGGLSLETLKISGDGAQALLGSIEGKDDALFIKDADGTVYSATFDGETGSVKVDVAVPEPSAFGLLAGLGALALVAARRRRSR